MSDIGHCENCRYWDNSTQHGHAQPDTTGLCRASRPKINRMDGMAAWPFTEDTDWCGSFADARRDAEGRNAQPHPNTAAVEPQPARRKKDSP